MITIKLSSLLILTGIAVWVGLILGVYLTALFTAGRGNDNDN